MDFNLILSNARKIYSGVLLGWHCAKVKGHTERTNSNHSIMVASFKGAFRTDIPFFKFQNVLLYL